MEDWDSTNTTTTTKFDTLTGDWSLTDNAFVNKVWNIIVKMLRWVIVKNALYAVFFFILAVFFGYTAKDKKLADQMASHAASDNPFGMYESFVKEKKPKIKLMNNHPLYASEIVKEWQEEYKQDFGKLYQYITIMNASGMKEDLMVMRKAAYEISDTEKKRTPLEISTTFGTDAENVCDDYFGEVPTNYQKTFFDKRRHFRIKRIKDELTHENSEGAKQFRCVIDQEAINDLLDE